MRPVDNRTNSLTLRRFGVQVITGCTEIAPSSVGVQIKHDRTGCNELHGRCTATLEYIIDSLTATIPHVQSQLLNRDFFFRQHQLKICWKRGQGKIILHTFSCSCGKGHDVGRVPPDGIRGIVLGG